MNKRTSTDSIEFETSNKEKKQRKPVIRKKRVNSKKANNTKAFTRNLRCKKANDIEEYFINTFYGFKIANRSNKRSVDYVIDTYLLYSDTLTVAVTPAVEKKLNEHVLENISKVVLNENKEFYVNEFSEPWFKENNLLSITISSRSKSKNLKNNYRFNHVPVCPFKSTIFEITHEKSSLTVGKQWLLPNLEFHGLWESLEFSENIKEELLDYCIASLTFSNHQVNSKIISHNRLILFYGEPGCGKTSLAKAFSQKLSVKSIGDYKSYRLIDINSNFLLSEYYSQSGKLLTIVFQKLKELSSNNIETFYVVLIDEVETLLTSRDIHCSNTNEPLDSLRAVNVILTQLDQIKHFKNVLIITTSNLSEILDTAFLDRADLKFMLKQPCLKSIYKIYMACTRELIRKELLCDVLNNESNEKISKLLYKVCKESEGLSGRFLRKLPFLAYCNLCENTIEFFLQALLYEIQNFKLNSQF